MLAQIRSNILDHRLVPSKSNSLATCGDSGKPLALLSMFRPKKHFLGAQILQKIFTTSWFCLKCQHLVEQETFMTNHWMECGTIFADKPSWRLMMSKGCIALARVWQFKAFREQTNIYPKQPSALILIPSGNSGNLTLQWRIPAFNGNSWDNHL